MKQPMWDWSAMTALAVSLGIAVIGGCCASLLTLLRSDALDGERTKKPQLKLIFCLSALVIGTIIDIILWVGVTTTPGVLHEDVLATIAVALGILMAATFAEAGVLAADAFSYDRIRDWLMPATVVFQRAVALVGAGIVVVIVSDTREDLQPGIPAWHLVIRVAYVMVPLVVGRWCAISWRRARKAKNAAPPLISTRASAGTTGCPLRSCL